MKNLKKKLMVLLSAFMIVTLLLALSTSVSMSGSGTTICHIAKDGVKEVTIAIGAQAVEIHLDQHGDTIGACP